MDVFTINGDVMTPQNRHQLIEILSEDFSFEDELIILILNNSKKKIGPTRIQKIAFLIKNSINSGSSNDYTPYYFGPFSEEIQETVEILMDYGIIGHENNKYYLTKFGFETYNHISKDIQNKDQIEYIITQIEKYDDKTIVELVYKMFPETTRNSIIKDNVMKRDSIDVRKFKSKDELISFLRKLGQ